MSQGSRKIIHIDLDCFYAQVEMRDNPKLKDLPVAVGGQRYERGVIATCNYVARRFGVHSAMSTTEALELCPDLILLNGNMAKYRKASDQIREIFLQYTHKIEPLSLDEAYLDVTDSEDYHGSATWIAQVIREHIWQKTHLTASAGIACNKLLAKIASDWRKPNGQYVVAPEHVENFIKKLPVKKLYGVGKATEKKLYQQGLITCEDLQQCSLPFLIENYGAFGARLYQYARGIDHRQVKNERQRKSQSVEVTYPEDLVDLDQCLQQMPALIEKCNQRLDPEAIKNIKRIFVKVKFNNFVSTTVTCNHQQLSLEKVQALCQQGFARQQRPVRLLGVGVGFADETEGESNVQQLSFPFA